MTHVCPCPIKWQDSCSLGCPWPRVSDRFPEVFGLGHLQALEGWWPCRMDTLQCVYGCLMNPCWETFCISFLTHTRLATCRAHPQIQRALWWVGGRCRATGWLQGFPGGHTRLEEIRGQCSVPHHLPPQGRSVLPFVQCCTFAVLLLLTIGDSNATQEKPQLCLDQEM